MINLEKKSFPVDIASLDAQVKSIAGSKYKGLVSSGVLSLNFSEDPTQEELNSIGAYWSGLTEAGEAAKLTLASRKIGQDLVSHLNSKKTACASKTWDQMSVAERKLVMGASMTEAEIDSL